MKTNIKTAIAAIAIALSLSSCATIFSGTKCKVKITDGTPVGAKVYVNGNYEGTAPCKVKVSKNGLKNSQTVIELRADGYASQKITLTRKLKVGSIVGNLLCSFGIGIVIDVLTGAIYKASPGKIHYNLDKK